MGRYAMTYADTSAFPQTVTEVPTKLGYISAYTLVDSAEAEPGFNSIKARVQGPYLVNASIALTTDTAENFYISIYKNGVATGYRNGSYVDTTGLGNIQVHGVLPDLNPNDVIELYIQSGTAGSYSITVGAAQFSMVAI